MWVLTGAMIRVVEYEGLQVGLQYIERLRGKEGCVRSSRGPGVVETRWDQRAMRRAGAGP